MNDYTRRLAAALEKKAKLADEIDFLRGQIKQEAKQTRWAKKNPEIDAVRAVYPMMEIEHGAGCSYITVKLAASELVLVPAGWELVERSTVHERLNSPIIFKYRKQGVPALLYVTHQAY